jgi:hypothetical protein
LVIAAFLDQSIPKSESQVAIPFDVTESIPHQLYQTNARVSADKPGMPPFGRACLRLPPGFLENPCLSHATCMHQRGGDASIPLPHPPLPVGESGFPLYSDVSAADCPACPNVPGNVVTGISGNIPTLWNIPCDIPTNNLTTISPNATVLPPVSISQEIPSGVYWVPVSAPNGIPIYLSTSSNIPSNISATMPTIMSANATVLPSFGISSEIPPTQPSICCTMLIANCNHKWSTGPSNQTVRNQTNSGYGVCTIMQGNGGRWDPTYKSSRKNGLDCKSE